MMPPSSPWLIHYLVLDISLKGQSLFSNTARKNPISFSKVIRFLSLFALGTRQVQKPCDRKPNEALGSDFDLCFVFEEGSMEGSELTWVTKPQVKRRGKWKM